MVPRRRARAHGAARRDPRTAERPGVPGGPRPRGEAQGTPRDGAGGPGRGGPPGAGRRRGPGGRGGGVGKGGGVPTGVSPRAWVRWGRPAEDPEPSTRLPLDELVHWDAW